MGEYEDLALQQAGISKEEFNAYVQALSEEDVNDAGDRGTVFSISHRYYLGGRKRVWIARESGDVRALHAALYCQFKCEEWYGESELLTITGIARLLVKFYGFRQHGETQASVNIDMHDDRERYCGAGYRMLMADASLHREGLRAAMAEYLDN